MAHPNLLHKRQSEKSRLRALSQFHDLLGSETKEADWQAFFDDNPFVFSESLSVRFDGLYRQVRLESGIPDYVLRRSIGNAVGDYGVIELKRPDHSIIGSYSSKIITPSHQLRVAQQQVSLHLNALACGQFLDPMDFAIVGTRRYAFIIIGNSREITRKCRDSVLRQQYCNFLPVGFHLYTYDELFSLFSSTISPVVQVLIPAEFQRESSICYWEFNEGNTVEVSYDRDCQALLLPDIASKYVPFLVSKPNRVKSAFLRLTDVALKTDRDIRVNRAVDFMAALVDPHAHYTSHLCKLTEDLLRWWKRGNKHIDIQYDITSSKEFLLRPERTCLLIKSNEPIGWGRIAVGVETT